MIPLNENDLKPFLVHCFSSSDFLSPSSQIWPGDEVFIVGYPLGFQDEANNLPVFRNGLIATSYGVPYEGKPQCLIDANLHPGTSGSPVLLKPKSLWVDRTGTSHIQTGLNYFLIGIHSASLSVDTMIEKQPLGLNICWYAGLLEEILQH